ncbi:MAG: radical SAM protein, partial [Ruminococcus sp.]|nr:radical SAM protein [Candidatus Copronaster equi]
NVHTAVETNGSSPHLTEIQKYVDYMIMDFKHYDTEIHKKWIGTGNEAVKDNIEFFFNSGRQIHIRMPLIKGVNDNPDGFVEYFSQFDTSNAVFEFLPYHEFGKEKWTQKYEITDGFISDETLKDFYNKFKTAGLKTVST